MTFESNSASIINRLQLEITQILTPLFPEHGKFALVDFPNYDNIGDSAIWQGQIDYFRKIHRAKPSYVSEITNFCSERFSKAVPDGTIFIQGGGNFGDLWPVHQDFRERLLCEFKDMPIVQLPQSIHFDHQVNLEKSKEYINAHPDFTLLVRDHKSLEIAKANYTCKIFLCPDMAFFMGLQKVRKEPEFDLFCLMRTDKEKVKLDDSALQNTVINSKIVDWPVESPDYFKRMKAKAMVQIPFALGLGMLNKNMQREFLYRELAANRVACGLNMLASGKMVVTDRLHAHILSLLLDIKHIRLDNSYGKISGFAKAWTQDSNISFPAANIDEALCLIEAESKLTA